MKGLDTVFIFRIVFASTIAVIGFVVLLILKLTGVVDWSWLAITAPLWLFGLFMFLAWLVINFLLWEATREVGNDKNVH